jgi:hypothetical protein
MGLMKKLKDGLDSVVKETKDSVNELKNDIGRITSDGGTGTAQPQTSANPQPQYVAPVVAQPQPVVPPPPATSNLPPSAYSPWLYRSTAAPRYAANNIRAEHHPIYHAQVRECVTSYEAVGLNQNGQLVLDAWDKALRRAAKAVRIELVPQKIFGGGDGFDLTLDLGVFVTDSRIIFYSPTYKEKGDTYIGWGIGGMIAAAVATAGSAAAAEMNNNTGMVALGHLRYEWITGIGYICHPKRGGFLDLEIQTIQIEYTDSKNRPYYVDLYLAGGENARDIANDLLHRICSYRLAMSDVKDPKAAELWEYYARPISVIPPAPNEQQHSIIRLPPGYTAPNGEDVRPEV